MTYTLTQIELLIVIGLSVGLVALGCLLTVFAQWFTAKIARKMIGEDGPILSTSKPQKIADTTGEVY